MSIRGRYEDVSTLLYLVPIVVPIVYALVLWAQSGLSVTLPSSVYLTVTRDPILFIVASLAVMGGIIIEVNGTEPKARQAKLASLGGTLQSIAVASLVIVVIAALYANGFTDVSGAATDFVVGRYGLVFPAALVLLSYLITVRFKLPGVTRRQATATIALLLVPVALYEIGRRETAVGIGVAFALLIIGIVLYLSPAKTPSPPKQE
ncbi:MAG TPA: hypothetical protein VLY82_06065 [Nitrososphaerales archaeon]|nr:hypothetical protein [Nitrososphaerales archaeon]